ncbi:TPA: DUF2972 domain-containing protein, partial [Campylobacter coli]|nr:DUF2972 domain-containing protein [Campylobacter coli]
LNINKYLIKIKHNLLKDLSFLVDKEEINKIDKYYKHIVMQYQIDFLNVLEKRIKYIEKSKLTTEQVLNYLRKNSELSGLLKQILDKELFHIKQHRPDIVTSWRYYQEFEKYIKSEKGLIINKAKKDIMLK